ncbi:MAG: hypothetical protein IKJ19_05050 [Clostridia bacterium]|nr:hypothetical protein [Clostridia bacterium]
MKEYLLPTRVVDYKGVVNAEALYKKKAFYGIHNSDDSTWHEYTKLEDKGSYIVLDFGKEMHGGIRILTGWIYYATCKVRIRFGESLGEVNSSIGEKNAVNAHSPRDFETIITASGDLTIGQTGFRFVRIDVLEEKYVHFINIFCENNIFKKKPIYTYNGSDKRIKDIFEVAKRTVDLCSASGYIWDGIKRDRLVWVGDLAPEIMALTSIYGRLPLIERSLNLGKKLAPLPKVMNRIATYSAWWIIILADYYKEFKCGDFIKKNLSYLVGLIDLFDDLIDKNGNLNPNYRYLVDWPTKDTPDEEVGIRTIFIMGLNSAIYLLNEFGLNTYKAEKVKDKFLIKPLTVTCKKQVIALKYFALGKISDEEYNMLIDGRAKGFSTFMSYYILSAIASRNKALAIDLMKEYYGAMLDRGATSFWEDFNMDWLEGSGRIDEIDLTKKDIHGDYGAFCYVGFRHSLCHGWSAGVVKFIKENCK